MKKMIILGAMLAVTGLSVPVLAQTPKSPKLPDATATQMQAEAKPAPDDLITLLAAKGILTETEAALVSQRPPLPETKQVLAEVLLSKHIITKEEYDRTLQSCSNSPTTSGSTSSAPATPSSNTAASSLPSPSAKGESSGFKSLSDRIAAILPGGGQTTDADFGVIQPSPRWSSPDQAALAEAQAKAKRKSHKKQEQDASQASSVPR
jgi:hypothetical protein